MKAALLTAPYQIELQEVAEPPVGPSDVLIKVRWVGICGSDLHTYKGNHPFRKPPVILGHEMAGEVVGTGKDVTLFQEGDRVTVEPQTYCHHCSNCDRGNYNLCNNKRVLGTTAWPGAFAEYVAVPEDKVYLLPEGLSLEQGALVEPLAVGVHAAGMAAVGLGDSVLIVGSGTIGLASLVALREAGATRIIATDVEDFNLAKARELGAWATVNARREPLADRIREWTEGEGVDAVVIAVGLPSLIDDSLDLLRKRGRMVLVAIFDEEATFDSFKIVFTEVDLVGSWTYSGREFHAAIDLMGQKRIDMGSFITHRWPIERVKEGFDLVDKRGEGVIKVILHF
ncbi:MAG: galactitol-1-phosphate 5-dehydrogenase [Deltaproteobacteria bacterium]|nr:galactitol-1-phosphate 5-dehydrogenase [Deltaproteobacteria bacterium]